MNDYKEEISGSWKELIEVRADIEQNLIEKQLHYQTILKVFKEYKQKCEEEKQAILSLDSSLYNINESIDKYLENKWD